MRRIIAGITVALATLVGTIVAVAPPAGAITGNFTPDYEHDYVGLVVFYDENGEFLHRCSGSLLSPTVFLTAGHCTADTASARIYFAQDAGADYDPATELDPTTGYPDTCLPQPDPCVTAHTLYNFGYDGFVSYPNTHDVGVVILDQPVMLDEYASLAAPGTLDAYGTGIDADVTVSGYGLSSTNPAMTESYRSRLQAKTFIINLGSAHGAGYNVQLATNRGGGRGGTCYGDSGGPVLLDDSDVVVAVNSFVHGFRGTTCRGTAYAFRTDTQAVIDWILSLDGVDPDQINIVEI